MRNENEVGSNGELKREKAKIGDETGQDEWGEKLKNYLRVGGGKTDKCEPRRI